jgi:hypothetical protein
METIEQAKQELRQYWIEGCICPCCGQDVVRYDRQIYKTIAKQLISLYRLNQGKPGFYHVRTIAANMPKGGPKVIGGDFAKLRYWGLIEQGDNDDPDKRSSGTWRITAKGIDFVEKRITIPKFAYTYNKKCVGMGGPQVSILDCLRKDKFKYGELMGFLI